MLLPPRDDARLCAAIAAFSYAPPRCLRYAASAYHVVTLALDVTFTSLTLVAVVCTRHTRRRSVLLTRHDAWLRCFTPSC